MDITIVEKLRRQQMEEINRKEIEGRKKERKKLRLWVLSLIILILGGYLIFQALGNHHFEITYYHLASEKIDTSIKVVVLSDLHNVEFGEQNKELIEAVRKEQPDFIAMLGDMVNKDSKNATVVQHLCSELGEIAPVYYSLGNHEGTLMYGRLDTVALDKILAEEGVKVLINQATEFKKGDTTILIAGTSTGGKDYDYWAKERLESFWNMEGYKIFLSHYPNLYYNKLKDADFDLALAGHYHGGLIRIPGLGGLYHPEGGVFPRYSGGEYSLSKGTLIVSRGLGGHGWIPRINNRPELVIVEIN